jgi:hypothetical protein
MISVECKIYRFQEVIEKEKAKKGGCMGNWRRG